MKIWDIWKDQGIGIMKPPKSRKWDHEMGSQHETDQNQGNGIMKRPKSRKWDQKRKKIRKWDQTKIKTRQDWSKYDWR